MQVCYSYSIYQNEVIIRTNAIAIIKANICTLVTNKYNVMFHIWFHAACTRVKLQSSGICTLITCRSKYLFFYASC